MVLGVLVAVILLVFLAAGWYASNLLKKDLVVDQPDPVSNLVVETVDPPRITYTNSDDGAWIDEGLMGLDREGDGYAQTGPAATVNGAEHTRVVVAEDWPPPLAVGDRFRFDKDYYPENPQVGMGIRYEDVAYESPLGPNPAWFVPGRGTTWAIFTHGKSTTPREGLRMLSTLHRFRLPTLLITYRNDDGAQQGSGYATFGVDEWEDLQSAVEFARANGAQRILLTGASMGGSTTISYLLNAGDTSDIVGAFLDSPATSFSAMVDQNAGGRGIPGPVTGLGKQISQWRFGIDFGASDYNDRADEIEVPMAVVVSEEDRRAYPETIQPFLDDADPSRTEVLVVPRAGHVAGWNVDRPMYDRFLSDFIREVLPVE